MVQDMNLKELEKKAWKSYFDDGLLDITIGLFVIAFGLGMTTRYTYLTVVAWMVIFFFAGAKKVITLPRVGLVKFSPERERRLKKETLFFVVFFSATALMGLGFLIAYSVDLPHSIKTVVGELALVSYELIIAMGLFFVAYWKQIKRFYAYAVLTLAASVGSHMLGAHDPYGYFHVLLGVPIMSAGVVVLIRFLRKYPIPAEEASNVS